MIEFAQRMKNMEKSAGIIAKLFQSVSDLETISFSIGAPAREALPVDAVRDIAASVLARGQRGEEALQYASPQGLLDLRQVVASQLLAPKGVSASAGEIIIVSGGMECISLICQVFINPGDTILVEAPTFVHSVETFDMFQANCVAVKTDSQGIDPEDLEAKIQALHPKMVYVVPTFQNPSGVTLTRERRQRVAELGSRYHVVILEDDPYRDLRYSGEELPPIKAFDQTGHTVLANSFSKIFSPGSRLGYVCAAREIIQKLLDAKSATNSHAPAISQVLCAEFFKQGYFESHLPKICQIHKERRDVMMECLEKYFPKGSKWVCPDGGLFTWVELPGNVNTTELLKEAADYKVSFVAGEGFFTEGGGKGQNCMRLSFSSVEPEKIRIGIERLGRLVQSKLDA